MGIMPVGLFSHTINKQSMKKISGLLLLCCLLWVSACKTASQTEEAKAKAEALRSRAVSSLQKQDYATALSQYDSLLRLTDTVADYYFERAIVKEFLADTAGAIQDYERAIKLNRHFADAWCNKGELYRLQKRYQEAIEALSKAIRLQPRIAILYYNRGLAYAAIDSTDAALDDFTTALDLAPNFAYAHLERGKVLYQTGHRERACQEWAKAYEKGLSEAADWVKQHCLQQ